MEPETQQLNERAEALMDAEQWTEAIELIESKPLLFESDAELSWNLGWAYFKLDDWKTAQSHLSRARDLEPARAASWWALGVVQREDGLLEEAERNVREALRLRDSSSFRRTLALILMQRGKLGEAEQVHLKGIELKPDSPERWGTYACFLDDCGRQTEAQAAYKKARLFRGN
jgi:Flp pilus assembly protein TadD